MGPNNTMGTSRSQTIENLFNQKDRLTLKDPIYKQWVFRYTFLELEKDLDEKGDITTDGLIKDKEPIIARIYANQEGIMAGEEEIKYFISQSNPIFKPRINQIQITKILKDGDSFKKDDVLTEMQGYAKDILKVERTMLNLLQHMSGIATNATKILERIKNIEEKVLITGTRKTTWGWLDKKALVLAGCGTHRLNLADAVLIKDNHIALFNNDIKKVLFSFHPPTDNYKFFEIEIDDKEKVLQAAKIIYEMQKNNALPNPAVIMLDNMLPEEITVVIDNLKKENLYENILIEASGKISPENILKYAKTGVDVISMGSLTQNIKPVDLSLEIKVGIK